MVSVKEGEYDMNLCNTSVQKLGIRSHSPRGAAG